MSARNSGYLPKNKIKTAKKEAQKIINGIAKIEIKRLENVINISQTNSNNYKQLQQYIIKSRSVGEITFQLEHSRVYLVDGDRKRGLYSKEQMGGETIWCSESNFHKFCKDWHNARLKRFKLKWDMYSLPRYWRRKVYMDSF